jgi:hypothetical protein|tara:strand:+ start:318 stop:629 length:312 start_codon:yes stop_codon:yes gene_type:complete
MTVTSKTLTVELTAEEFGALAGAVSTEWQKRMDQDQPASRYISIRLQDAWMKMLRAWHGPELEDGMLASSDWVTLFQPNPATSKVRDQYDGGPGHIAEVIPIR